MKPSKQSPQQQIHQTQTYILSALSTDTIIKLTLQILNPSSSSPSSSSSSSIAVYRKQYKQLSEIGSIENYCDSFKEVKEYLRNPDNIGVDVQGAVVSIYGQNPMKKGKVIKLATIQFQFCYAIATHPKPSSQSKNININEEEHKKLVQTQQILNNKITYLQHSLNEIKQQLIKLQNKQINKDQPQPDLITRKQFQTQIQKLKEFIVKQHIEKISNHFDAPSMIQSEYECGLDKDLSSYDTDQSRRMSFAENFLAQLNDEKKRVSGFIASKETEVVMEIVSQMQEKLGIFMDRTQKKISKLTETVQKNDKPAINSEAFKKSSVDDTVLVYPAFSQGIRNIMALSLSLKYPIPITNALFIEHGYIEEQKIQQDQSQDYLKFNLFGSDQQQQEPIVQKNKPEAKKAPAQKKALPPKKKAASKR